MATKPQLRKTSPPAKETVTTNISPFEVIPRGTLIVIESSAPIHERALRSSLRFTRGGLKPAVNDQQRRVTFTVDDAFPAGRNTLHLTDLFTVDNQRLDVDYEIPFFVIDTKAKVPSDVKIQAYSRVVVEDDHIRRPLPGENPTHELMKGIRRSDGKPWEGAFDSAGVTVDFKKVVAKVDEAYAARYGKLHPDLHEQLAASSAETISVAIWLDADLPMTEKDNRRVIQKRPRAEEEERKKLVRMANRFKEHYKLTASDKNVSIDPGAPVIFAELDRHTIKQLAQAPEVATIFLHDRKGVDDLGNSIVVAQTGNAHALGFTGARVNVAVYEASPDDVTDLVIAGRFQTSPPETTSHARLTHAIIRNQQVPGSNGHAPDCRLHSANNRSLAAIRWAADEGCTVISQSFHRTSEQTNGGLSFDDIYKDHLVRRWPWPTICEAAGNYSEDDTEFVNHKGYNRLTVGNHNDRADAMDPGTVFRNPNSPHGDRELPEISANGTAVSAVDLTNTGTSFAAPAVAGAAACIQEADRLLRIWPEGCRAILLASARLNPDGGTWWNDVLTGRDGLDGTGALNTLSAVRVAEKRQFRDNSAASRGWDVNILRSSDIGPDRKSVFTYNIKVPNFLPFLQASVKVALAWHSRVWVRRAHHNTTLLQSTLTVDLDLDVFDKNGFEVASSRSWDNSYEIAEFRPRPGEKYTIKITRFSGDEDVQYGIAWNTEVTQLIAEQ